MKRIISALLALLMCLALISCGKKETPAADEAVSEIVNTPEVPENNNHLLIDQTEKHTNLTADEKLEILNDLKNKEIVSAFIVIDDQAWCSAELSAEKQPEAFEKVVEYFAKPLNEYEHFVWDVSELTDYDAYVILTDAQGEQYTIFVQDYSIIHYDEQIGTFPNGNPEYAYTEAAAVCFDGDWFVIKETLVWWPLIQLDIDYIN